MVFSVNDILVYRGKCRQLPVAIKILHRQNFDAKTIIAFKREVKIMRYHFHFIFFAHSFQQDLPSQHKVPPIRHCLTHSLFLGACMTPGKCMIVTELMPKGDLESILRDKRINLSLYERMKMARDAVPIPSFQILISK